MLDSVALGVMVTSISGLIMGTSPWPLKLLRRYQYEHFGIVSMFFALLILPISITLIACPRPFEAIATIPTSVLLKANAFSFAWGIAQVLALLCFLRIGVSLTYGILCSIGAGVGVVTPMILKASGRFANAPDLNSSAGVVVLVGLAVLVVGVLLAAMAGIRRERERQTRGVPTDVSSRSESFSMGLVMVVVAGFLSAGWGFAFAYSQGPIIDAMKAYGASEASASIAVWALALPGAALVNTAYPAWLLLKNQSISVFFSSPSDFLLVLVYGALFFIPSLLLGQGMLMLGALGASVGFGLVQGTLILGGQLLGFLTGEWRGAVGMTRSLIYTAIAVLIFSMVILSAGNALAMYSKPMLNSASHGTAAP